MRGPALFSGTAGRIGSGGGPGESMKMKIRSQHLLKDLVNPVSFSSFVFFLKLIS